MRKDRKDDGAEARIVFLGHLQRRKGVHDLIDALAREEVVGLRWRAILAGGGADQAEFEAQAVQAGLKESDRISRLVDGTADPGAARECRHTGLAVLCRRDGDVRAGRHGF
ncbi:MAG: glycosyltransferase [Aliidongia sp.]